MLTPTELALQLTTQNAPAVVRVLVNKAALGDKGKQQAFLALHKACEAAFRQEYASKKRHA
jgi:hypothetical protein